MNAIEIQDLRKAYASKEGLVKALDGVSFAVKRGGFFGLLGPNGAGKTTTINILSGLLLKDSGTVKILGKDPEQDWEYVKNRMNVTSAYFGLAGSLTVEQNLKVYARIFQVRNSQERIQELLAMFNITQLKKTLAFKLSSGERTRLTLCKGLINNPEVLLLDECTVGLDPEMADRTREIIKSYQKDRKATILFTSHYMPEVELLCDTIALLHQGKILKIDTAKALKKLIKHQTVEIDFVKADAKIKGILEERGIKVLSITGNSYFIETSAVEDTLYKALNVLFQQGYKITDLQINKPTLEDLFIKVARGEL